MPPAPPPPPLAHLEQVAFHVAQGAARHAVLRGIDLRIDAGEFVVVTGRSGAGKSTLLQILAGVLRPTSGHAWLLERDLARLDDAARAAVRRRVVGILFQDARLLPYLSALDNVALPAVLDLRADAHARAAALLDQLELGDRAGHLPHQLSGGEAQRVALGRALINAPRLLLADEPTGSLDEASGARVLALLRSACLRPGTAVVLASHERDLARSGDRVLTLRDGSLRS